MIDFADDPATLLFQLGLGPWCIPLRPNSKLPQAAGWRTSAPVDEATVRGWLVKGFNLGLRTGACSGITVIDDDRAKYGLEPFDAPPTGLSVSSPTGSKHYYYRLPPGGNVRNSTSKLAPHVDVRGEGGYVVVPPSIHPEAREEYRWAALGEPAPWPFTKDAETVVNIDMTAPRARLGGYATVALLREVEKVQQAAEGTRNDTLNDAAYNLGQLVAGGALESETVRSELMQAALACGLPETEAAKTITSGLRGGAAKPRGVPERAPAAAPAPARDKKNILVPGSHKLEHGEYREQGNHLFVDQVLRSLPRGALYRRGGKVGVVRDGAFVVVGADELRCVVDRHVRLVVWKAGKGEDDKPAESFRVCSRDLAALVLASAPMSDLLPELAEIVQAPVLLPGGRVLDTPGFDEASKVYFAPPAGVQFPNVPATPSDSDARDAGERLLRPFAEFPMDRVGRSVLLAFMLSLAARPAIAGPVPGLLVRAPEWGAGKGLLVSAAACAITGEVPPLAPAPGGRAGDAESEWRKRITTSLLAGERVRVIDNIADGATLVSESLEAALTAVNWSERLLGSNDAPKLKARTVWAITGVNLQLGQALGRRCLRIDLQPTAEDPAARTFQIPGLAAHVNQAHPTLVVDALTLLKRYIALGSPKHGAAPLGSFESWDALVRGCVAWAMQTDPVASIHSARKTDPARAARAALMEVWARKYPSGQTAQQAVQDSANDADLLGALDTFGVVGDDGIASSQKLGSRLKGVRGSRVGRRRFESRETRQNRAVWVVIADGEVAGEDGVRLDAGADQPHGADVVDRPQVRPNGVRLHADRPHPHSNLTPNLTAKNGLCDPASGAFDSSGEVGEEETPLLAGEGTGGGKRGNTRSGGECGVSSSPTSPEHAVVHRTGALLERVSTT